MASSLIYQPVHMGAWDRTGSNWFDFVCSVNSNRPTLFYSELDHRKLSNWIDPEWSHVVCEHDRTESGLSGSNFGRVLGTYRIKLTQCNLKRWLLVGQRISFQPYRALEGIHEQLEGATRNKHVYARLASELTKVGFNKGGEQCRSRVEK